MIFSYKIEGFGCPETGELFRLSTDIPANMAQVERDLYIDALTLDSVSPRAESTDWMVSKTSFTSANFMCATNAGLPDRLRYFWVRIGALKIGDLAATVSSTDTTFAILVPGHDDTVAYIGREAVKLGTDIGGGIYTGCIRGYLETIPQRHQVEKDTSVYNTMHPQTFVGRRVTYSRIPDDATLVSSEQDAFSYGLKSLKPQGFNGLKFLCISSLTTQHKSKSAVKFATGVARPTLEGIGFIELDIDQDTGEKVALANPANPTFLVGDSVFPVVDQEDALYLSFDITRQLFAQAPPEPDDLEGAAFEVLTALPDIGSLGYDDGVYYGDLLTILLNIWTSTSYGDNGPFDIGIDCGLRQNIGFWDIDDCRALRETLGNEISAPLFVLKPGATNDKTLKGAEKMLQAHQIAIAHNDAGRLAFVRPFDSATVYQTVTELDQDSILYEDNGTATNLQWDMNLERTVSLVQVKYNQRPGIKASSVTINDATFDDRSQGRAGEIKLNMGVQSSHDIAYTVAYNWAFRYRNVVPTASFKTEPGVRLPIGSSVLLSHPRLPTWVSEQGYMAAGAKDLAAVVTSYRPRKDATEYVCDLVGLRYDRVAPRAPALLVDSYQDPGSVFCVLSEYVTDRHPVYTYDTEAFKDGDIVQILKPDGSQRTTATFAIVVEAIDEITLVGESGEGITAGDVIVFAPHAVVTSDQLERGIFQASTAGTVNGDRGYQWQG
ncbi:MAG: hypothetical protein KUG67_02555 [Proteobacteria bacterium]|nr:hypothetical protein [Pseudomonadota bacterium]